MYSTHRSLIFSSPLLSSPIPSYSPIAPISPISPILIKRSSHTLLSHAPLPRSSHTRSCCFTHAPHTLHPPLSYLLLPSPILSYSPIAPIAPISPIAPIAPILITRSSHTLLSHAPLTHTLLPRSSHAPPTALLSSPPLSYPLLFPPILSYSPISSYFSSYPPYAHFLSPMHTSLLTGQ